MKSGMRSFIYTGIFVTATLVLSACAATPSHASGATTVPTESYTPATQPASALPTAAPAEVTLNVATDPNLGQILVDGAGMTLYAYTNDSPDQVTCTGACAVNWPPLVTQGNPTAGPGVDAALIGTATPPDGSLVVTYNHMPLYHWYKDQAPGDTSGQGVKGVWYVVSPDGSMVQK